jgi:hypothetical protein
MFGLKLRLLVVELFRDGFCRAKYSGLHDAVILDMDDERMPGIKDDDSIH